MRANQYHKHCNMRTWTNRFKPFNAPPPYLSPHIYPLRQNILAGDVWMVWDHQGNSVFETAYRLPWTTAEGGRNGTIGESTRCTQGAVPTLTVRVIRIPDIKRTLSGKCQYDPARHESKIWCIPRYFSSYFWSRPAGSLRHVCTVFHANIRRFGLPTSNIRWNITQTLDPTLKPSSYKKLRKIRMCSALKSKWSRRF